MSSDDDEIDQDSPEEEQQPEYSTDSLKESRHFLIEGKPPTSHSPFSILAKKPKWPQNLWKMGTLVYNLTEPDQCLAPPDSPTDTTLRFDSRFESGNLNKAYLIGPDTYHLILEYDRNPSGSCQWFYFNVTNTRKDAKYTFYISGFHKGKSLYCSGARIFWYSYLQAKNKGISWSRGGSKYAYQVTKRFKKKKKRATLQFQIKFPYDNDSVCMCYALPYTFSDLLKSIQKWQNIAKPGYFTQDVLCETDGGRPCPILTITNPNSSVPMNKRECIFLTGRIHPGESNSSYVVHGLIDFLLSNDPAAHFTLDRCIVKCVPMINIDGVVEGFYRVSLSGNDLNRMWTAPDLVLHPVVNRTKALIKEIAQERTVSVYIDFHGHSRLHGTFAYGCPNDDDPELRDSEKKLPRVLSFLSDAFSWNHCVFSFPKERKAAGRIVVRTEVDVIHSFTIETSFGGVTSGPRAGCLYDEILWNELGAKTGVAIYHLLNGSDSPLINYVSKELSFLAPKPIPLSQQQESEQIPVEFNTDGEDKSQISRNIKPSCSQSLNYHIKQPISFLNVQADTINTSSNGVITPKWSQMQFTVG